MLVAAWLALSGILMLGAQGLESSFRWQLSPPLLSAADRPEDPCYSVKDPSVVRYGGKWHLFCTIRSKVRTHQIEYTSFDRWEDAAREPRHILHCREGYFCAPQAFFFRPQKRWYLIYQVGEPGRKLQLQPAFSTTTNVADPDSWSQAKLLLPDKDPDGVAQWIDFWVICDSERAYLFFTSLDGRMWRMWTPLGRFPAGFDHCEPALHADIFEAGHVYRVKGQNRYLTVVEAQGKDGRRYYKAYTAEKLGGSWAPLADSEERPFAGAANVIQPQPSWADNISHGELIRDGFAETPTVDPANLQFLIQGVTEARKAGRPYGQIPWQLGLLRLSPSSPPLLRPPLQDSAGEAGLEMDLQPKGGGLHRRELRPVHPVFDRFIGRPGNGLPAVAVLP